MPAISIVVPVYNVEKYLKKCLDSILAQSFRDFELLLINNGSTDGSEEICRVYVEKDVRVQLISQSSRGVSYARNTGLEKFQGECIIFIDADDYIHVDMMAFLYKNLQASGADMATCGIYNVYRQGQFPQCDTIEHFICDNIEAFRLLLVGKKIPGSLCNKLIKKDCVKGLRFPEGKLYEDAFFHTALMQKVDKVCVDTTPLYYYVHREGSITTKKFNVSSMDIVAAYENNIKVVAKKFPSILKEAEFKLIWAYFVVLDRMLIEDKYWELEQYKKVRRFLKRNVVHVIKNEYFYAARKIGAIALLINVRLYRALLKLNEEKNKKILP